MAAGRTDPAHGPGVQPGRDPELQPRDRPRRDPDPQPRDRPQRDAAHRLIGLWLLAAAPLLALPGAATEGTGVRVGLFAAHVAAAALLLTPALLGHHGPRRDAWGAVFDWLPLLLVFGIYWEVPYLARGIHGTAHFDAVVQGWEMALFGGQPSRSLAARWPWLWISEPLHAAYISFYFFIVVPPAVFQIRRRPEAVRRLVFVVLLAELAHASLFVLFPVLGPRYVFPAPTGPLEHGFFYRLAHFVLANGSSPGTAFPSSHVGIAVAVTVAVARLAPRAAPWTAALAAALALATVYGGFHYAVDALAGVALGGALALAAPAIRARIPLAGPGYGRDPRLHRHGGMV